MSADPRHDGLTRRALLGHGAGLALGGTLLSACGGSNSGSSKAPAAAAKPVRGGTLTYAAVAGAPGYDPARWWNGFVWDGVVATSDTLLAIDTKSRLVPRLSSSPEISADGMLYTFKLRSGVKFHHGRTMTADDAKFSLERLLSPATASEGISLYNALPIVGLQDVLDEKAKVIKGIRAVDDVTLEIELERPESVLPYVLTLPFASVVPRDVVEDLGDERFNTAPVGTGPYQMKDVDLEKGLVLERFDGHWDAKRPYLDRVEWSFGVDAELAALRIQDNQLDMMQERVPVGVVQQLRNDPAYAERLVTGVVNDTKYFTLNVNHEALKDVRVRTAIAMAVDRERLVRALKGLPKAATGGIFSPQSPYFQDGLAHPYDPGQAKQLLAEAGYPDGFELDILGQSENPFAQMAQTVQADLQAIGIRAKAKLASVEVFTAEAYTDNPTAMIAYLWDLPYPHGSYVIDGAFSKAAVEANCCNLSNYVDEDVEGLMRDAHATSDPRQLAELYRAIDKRVVQEDVSAIPAFYDVRTELMSERVRGFTVPKTLSAVHFFSDYWVEQA